MQETGVDSGGERRAPDKAVQYLKTATAHTHPNHESVKASSLGKHVQTGQLHLRRTSKRLLKWEDGGGSGEYDGLGDGTGVV